MLFAPGCLSAGSRSSLLLLLLLLFWRAGLFIDDSTGLGSEHSLLVRKTSMDAIAIADWNAQAHAAYVSSWTEVVARGGFVWNLLRDPDGRPALTYGVVPQPSNDTCTEWMHSKCGNASWPGASWPLMMSPGAGSERQSLAAFLLLRGPYAWWCEKRIDIISFAPWLIATKRDDFTKTGSGQT